MIKPILLEDLLNLLNSNNNKIKIKFNQYNGEANPLDLYKANPDEINNDWLFWRTKKRYFNVGDIVVCLLRLSYDTWLLTTIKKVTKEYDVKNAINYDGVEIDKFKQYFGRAIIKYHKTHQTQMVHYECIMEKLVINQILPTFYDGEDFPGYDNVRLSYQQLATIINCNKKDWIVALENQKAVYLITDMMTGKLYVGSATSDKGMLLQRWSNYITNGHGGNVDLMNLVKEKGVEYIKQNFQYSILENYNAKVEDKIILKRESWWKETLKTRKFGYNKN